MIIQKKLAKSVNLHLISEKKFKTVSILVRFREKISSENLAKRVILSHLFELSNAEYPSQSAFQTALAMNYGMQFSSNVSSKGKQHFLNLVLSVVDPRFVKEDTIEIALHFLKSVIFNPLLDLEGSKFNEKNVRLEKENHLHYLDSLNEDNSYLASRKLSELFFESQEMKLSLAANKELIQEVEADSLYQYYKDLVQTNMIDIFILGNLKESEIFPIIESWNFSDRPEFTELFYKQDTREQINYKETKKAQQSRLAMAWNLSCQYADEDYLTLQVFNGLFGGMPHSKLFSVIRERESLAYSISSSFDSFKSLLKVTAGTDLESLDRAEALVLSLLEEIKNGDFSLEDLEQTKSMLRNGFLASRDGAGVLIEEAFIQSLLPNRKLEAKDWLERLEKVTIEDIQKLAQKLRLQTSYKLEALSE